MIIFVNISEKGCVTATGDRFKMFTSSCHASAIEDHVTSIGHSLKWDHFDIGKRLVRNTLQGKGDSTNLGSEAYPKR